MSVRRRGLPDCFYPKTRRWACAAGVMLRNTLPRAGPKEGGQKPPSIDVRSLALLQVVKVTSIRGLIASGCTETYFYLGKVCLDKKRKEGNGIMRIYLYSQQEESISESPSVELAFEDIKNFLKNGL